MKQNKFAVKLLSLLLAGVLLTGVGSPAAASRTQATGEVEIFSPVASSASEYGYIQPRWADKYGNIIEADTLKNDAPEKLSLLERLFPSTQSVLPSAYDARNFGRVTSVKYQSDANMCWAFTAMGVLESYDISHGYAALGDADYSETHLAWFTHKSLSTNADDSTYGDGFNRDSPYLNGGNWCYTVGTLARWSGINDETDFPFDEFNYATQCVYTEAERYRNNGRLLRSMEQYSSVEDVKQAIYDNGAVEAAINYEDNIEATAANGDYVYYSPTTGDTNHAVIIVGWDDSYPVANFPASLRPSSPGAWLIRNSWSEYWGNEGYMWVSDETGSLSEFTSYTAMSAADYDNNYQHDGFGISHSYFYSANNLKVSNVFRADSNEILKAVCLYTITQNTVCSIRIYKNLIENYTSPVQGTLAYTSPEMTFKNLGYYTVDLEQEIELEPDEIFSVVVCYSGEASFVVEPSPSADTSPAFHANERESYYTIGLGGTWYDLVASGSGGNIHLKALSADVIQPALSVTPNTTLNEFMPMLNSGFRNLLARLFFYIFSYRA